MSEENNFNNNNNCDNINVKFDSSESNCNNNENIILDDNKNNNNNNTNSMEKNSDATKQSEIATKTEINNLDPTKDGSTKRNVEINSEVSEVVQCCEAVRPRHIEGGHTFIVSTVITETMTTTTTTATTKEAEIAKEAQETVQTIKACNVPELACAVGAQGPDTVLATDTASKAVVPLSSSLPSKLLRFHAKRSAQALLNQVSHSESLDSQFSSEECTATTIGSNEACSSGNCLEGFGNNTEAASSRSLMSHGSEEKLIDVGMGSSIEGSEESEEDDELKPLAVDNHVLHNSEYGSPAGSSGSMSPLQNHHIDLTTSPNSPPALLSEANLEKLRRHHHNLDNIYLHPNFRGDFEASDSSPPPAVAPNNSPIEQRRAHRSFLTMKKSTTNENEVDESKATPHEGSIAASEETMINEVDTLDPALIPNEQLAAEIAEAVEYYFSNESILKDAFLLKHVRRNKEGFVSLKLVSSFKRVRQLTKDWKVVGNAVRRKSRKIELNNVGTKVRRVDPLPNFDETMPSRTIVACDLPLDKMTIEKVSDIFSKCGEIALIRILKPGMAIPVDVRQFMNKYPEMQQKECALVEYLESSSAREARNLQGPFKVFEMVAPKKKTGKKAAVIQISAPVARMVENYRYYNDAGYEARARGGSFSGMPSHDVGDMRYKLKRNNSDFNPRSFPDAQLRQHFNQHQHHHKPGIVPIHQQQAYNNSNHQTHVPHHGYHHSPPPQQQQHHHSHYNSTHRDSFSGSGNLNNASAGGEQQHGHAFQHYSPRGSISHDSMAPSSSPSSNNFFTYSPRRYSNASTVSANAATGNGIDASSSSPTTISNSNQSGGNMSNITNPIRRISNCSDTNSHYSEMSRRPSNCSEHVPQRRDSNCSDNCPYSRRVSDYGQTEVYRKTSQGSICSGGPIERRFSNGSMQFERTFSNASDVGNNLSSSHGNNNEFMRRPSNDYNYERKHSIETQTSIPYDDSNVGGGGGGYNVFPRRYSNNFTNNVSNKLAAYDNAQYINGRRISTDSGYDRRYSFGSEYEGSPRSRTGSFINGYKPGMDIDGQPRSRTSSFLDGSPRSRSGSLAQRNAENLVRTPLGPDGSKGFGSRARKFGQTVSPVN